MADLDSYLNAYLVAPVTVRRRWNTVKTPTDAGGLGLRRQKWQAPLYEFDLRAVFPTQATADAFRTFLDGKKGSRASFTWTCIRDSHVYTCLGPDELEEPWDGMDAWEYQFTLVGTY